LFLSKAFDARIGYKIKKTNFNGSISNLSCKVVPFFSIRFFPKILRIFINEIVQSFIVLVYSIKNKPDVIYADRGNLIQAWLLSNLGFPVVWRCLGVMPYIERSNSSRISMRILYKLDRFWLRAPFNKIICTLDGSPWNKIFTSKKQLDRLIVLPNGCDLQQTDNSKDISNKLNINEEITVISVVGRLVPNKHQKEIIMSLINLINNGVNFVALIIGYGPQENEILNIIESNNCNNVIKFLGRVPHDDILSYLELSDISINLSEGGALGNVSLESISTGNCLITLGSDDRGINNSIKNFIPSDSYIRINKQNITKDIEATIKDLIDNKEKLNRIKNNAKRFFNSNILPWKERIDIEVNILQNAIKNTGNTNQ